MMMPNRQINLAEGEMFLVRKPQGWTSFDVVARMRTIFHFEKIGHAGALDPLATGLMIVCTGRMTKEIDRFMGLEKEYVATICLGGRTASFDSETAVIETSSLEGITADAVVSVLSQFVGAQIQIPPMWSALKVGGKPLYKYARKGRVVDRKPREVMIHSITPSHIHIPEVTFTVVCSKGTYIRALADDIGRTLGCGAYLTSLERTRIGEYRLEDAFALEDFVQFMRALRSV
jgi:tRNA pseudouridine55 synthase